MICPMADGSLRIAFSLSSISPTGQPLLSPSCAGTQSVRPDCLAWRLMRSTSSPPSGVFISRCIIPTSWLVSPFTAASAAPLDTAPLPQQLHQPLGIADLARRLRASLFLTRSAGRLSCPFLPLLS